MPELTNSAYLVVDVGYRFDAETRRFDYRKTFQEVFGFGHQALVS